MQDLLITWGVVALLGLGAVGVALPMARRLHERRRLERTIAASGAETMQNVLLNDGMGGQTFFEWLLLTPDRIQVLVTNSREGVIFAGERMDSWAHVMGQRTLRFDNPLYGLEESMVTLRYHLSKMVIEGHVLFTGECSFPKGRPEKVLLPSELEARTDEEVTPSVQPAVRQAWEQLQGDARHADPRTEGYLLPEKEPVIGRGLAIAALIAAAGGWLYLRYSG